MGFPLEEIQAAFDRFQAAANEAGSSGNWEPWIECLTEDVEYIEHHYGRFRGRDEVRNWIAPTMTTFPMDHMKSYPWNWHVIDPERGWVIGEVANVMDDPGDGRVYEAANWTRLVYGGDGLFREEEDIYNPAEFGEMMTAWMKAWKAHHPS